MLYIHRHSLLDFCGIRIAYMMWARRYVAKNCPKEIFFNECVEAVLSDVQGLQISEKCQAVILRLLEPTGKHLLSLLSLWIFAQPEDSQRWLTGDILFECLVFNADGLITQRKMAQKILSNRILDNVVAFRLACINFLEIEVLKLWTLVKEIFLKKLIQEGDQTSPIIGRPNRQPYMYLNLQNYLDIREYNYSEELTLSYVSSFAERKEVIFWISYCLSRENGIRIADIPHFLRNDFDWYEFSLEFATFSGNVACFDYFRNFCEYDPVHVIENISYFHGRRRDVPSLCFDRQVPCFISHYMLLSSGEQEDLFQKFPSCMLFFFLQWPLSLTFLDNIETLWNFVKNCVFKDMFELFRENTLRPPETNILFNLPFSKIVGIYSTEHLVRIWVALWNKSSETLKSEFLNSEVFVDIQHRGEEEFSVNFETSGMKEKLLPLFLSNGEAILELYENEFMKESLRNLVKKYIPEHCEDLDRKCISFLKNSTKLGYRDIEMGETNTLEKINSCPMNYDFLDYLKSYSFSLNRN